jgi:Leucine-rich repeat (LRR) protein
MFRIYRCYLIMLLLSGSSPAVLAHQSLKEYCQNYSNLPASERLTLRSLKFPPFFRDTDWKPPQDGLDLWGIKSEDEFVRTCISKADALVKAAENGFLEVRGFLEGTISLKPLLVFRKLRGLHFTCSPAGPTFVSYKRLLEIKELELALLEKFRDLEELYIVGCNLKSAEFLSKITHLRNLALTDNPVSDIKSVAKLRNLTSLSLQSTSIVDISDLQGLVGLRRLSLNNTAVSDITALMGLVNLESLSISNGDTLSHTKPTVGNRALTDLSSVSYMVNLTSLDISYNQVTNLNALASLPWLKTVFASFNKISDISGIRDLPNIETLWLDNNELREVQALRDLKYLKDARLNHNQIRDANQLKQLYKVFESSEATIQASANPIANLSLLSDDEQMFFQLLDR